jgi:hypothetical protein
MKKKKAVVEYVLADIVAFATRSLRGLRAQRLTFLRYGNEFIS